MKKKDEGKPLADLALDPGFSRNFKKIMKYDQGDPELTEMIADAVISAASERAEGKVRHAEASAKGGEGRREQLADEWQQRDAEIIRAAKTKLAGGVARRDLASILANIYGLTSRSIRDKLNKAGM